MEKSGAGCPGAFESVCSTFKAVETTIFAKRLVFVAIGMMLIGFRSLADDPPEHF
jgi:hypothetical protein